VKPKIFDLKFGSLQVLQRRVFIPVSIFIFSFTLIPLRQFRGLTLMPGDLGDARLNNYFLETIYLRLTGEVDSFWNMGMFFPYPLVGGFSDNHFGSAIFYVLPRYFLGQPETAFQIWFLIGYILNFSFAYLALRKLGMSSIGASVGAGIFAFALPTSAHAIHAQLHHRWAIPMAVAAISTFLKGGGSKWLGITALWITAQFYIGIYTGFFNLLFVIAIIFSHLIFRAFTFRTSQRSKNLKLFKNLNYTTAATLIGMLLTALVAIAALFFTYYKVSLLYVGARSWAEIERMLPRPGSYFIADHSLLWRSLSNKIEDIPLRWEHQMFVGLVPMILFLLGAIVMFRTKNRAAAEIYLATTLIVVLTLYVKSFSLWYFIHDFPLFSAIRAVTRVDQILLFAAGYGSALFLTWLGARKVRNRNGLNTLMAVIALLALLEAATGTIGTSEKSVWKERVANLAKEVPGDLPKDSVLYFAQTDPWYAHELDAMWVSLQAGKPTLNGYSGQAPPGWNFTYGRDCNSIPTQVDSYQVWANAHPDYAKNFAGLLSRIRPIGFINCDYMYFQRNP
jgi:hypothetical protein